jgi:hypothetical protein
MKREIEIGNNLGCLLVVVAVVAALAAVSIFGGGNEMSPDSVECVKAAGQWREPQGYCERGSKSP